MSASDDLSPFAIFFPSSDGGSGNSIICWAGTFVLVAIYTALLTPQYRAQATMKIQGAEEMGRPIEVGPYNLMGGSNNAFNPDSLLTPETVTESLHRLGKIQPSTPENEINIQVNDVLRRTRIFPMIRTRRL